MSKLNFTVTKKSMRESALSAKKHLNKAALITMPLLVEIDQLTASLNSGQCPYEAADIVLCGWQAPIV